MKKLAAAMKNPNLWAAVLFVLLLTGWVNLGEMLESLPKSLSTQLGGGLVLAAIAAIYFFPTLIAKMRKTRNSNGIFVLNFLIGWTIIGWIACLFAACLSNPIHTGIQTRSEP